jgi:hypothetical protein
MDKIMTCLGLDSFNFMKAESNKHNDEGKIIL